MKPDELVSTTPIQTKKSIRQDECRVLTSARGGKIIPIWYSPVLREDQTKGTLRIDFDMAETVHPLMNAVNVTAYAHFIPYTAFDRFLGLDDFNRSYQEIPEAHDGKPIPFIYPVKYSRNSAFWKTLGVHMKEGENINSAPLEAYNTLVNWRRFARSRRLPKRNAFDQTLAEAFWKNPNLWHIVPDYERAMMDGEVSLDFNASRVPVSGLAFAGQPKSFWKADDYAPGGLRQTKKGMWDATGAKLWAKFGENVNGNTLAVREDAVNKGFPAIFAELAHAGVTLSLSNIEMAKQTAAFAKLRSAFDGIEEEHIIDLLMEGIRVPDEQMRQPHLLARESTVFGYSERHAMDGANLEKSVTTGKTSITLRFRTPPMNTGGIILVTAEIVPEALFERQNDTFLDVGKPSEFPNFLRDFLDPDKVDIVQNKFVDVEHGNPTGTFGFAPLNHAWKRSLTRIGGRYFRPLKSAFVEDRQRFWSIEQVNPALTSDFYLVNNLPHTVFMDQKADPFEILALGSVQYVGNTVFGRALEENRNNYRDTAEAE